MAELQLKVGDKAMVTGIDSGSHCFDVDAVVTVIHLDAVDQYFPYKVADTEGHYDWMTPAQLTPLNETVEPKLDLHTVNHIHSYYHSLSKKLQNQINHMKQSILHYLVILKD